MNLEQLKESAFAAYRIYLQLVAMANPLAAIVTLTTAAQTAAISLLTSYVAAETNATFLGIANGYLAELQG